MGRRSTEEEFFTAGTSANLCMLVILMGTLGACAVAAWLLPWWSMLLAALVPAALLIAYRD